MHQAEYQLIGVIRPDNYRDDKGRCLQTSENSTPLTVGVI